MTDAAPVAANRWFGPASARLWSSRTAPPLGCHVIDAGMQVPQRIVWDVSALLQAAGDALSARFGACVVRGEISGLNQAASGHCYFTLKDVGRSEGALRCAMFRRATGLLDFRPADGQLVEARGRLGIYGPRGELQLVVESMQRGGAGALYERFLKLRERLAAEGLFDDAAKRPIPLFPRRVGVVTSLAAAALHDVLTAFARRAPQVEVVVYPSPVQGVDAPAALSLAIDLANRRAEVDTLILCRGGGSLEDLWAFNDERVVRAVRGSSIPLVCGVGHETDLTLADLAADLRAPTPTAAAELAAQPRASCLETLLGRATIMRRRVAETLDTHAQRLDRAALRLARPAEVLSRRSGVLALLAHRLAAAGERRLDGCRTRLERSAQRLDRSTSVCLGTHEARLAARHDRLQSLDPRRVLSRGYALLTGPDGHAVVSVHQAGVGMPLRALLADGSLNVAVTAVGNVVDG